MANINFKLKRTSTASKRPTPAQLDQGELGLCFDQNSLGLFVEDSNGDTRKIGPVEVSDTAPNSSPAGQSGNSIGELWLDTSGSTNLLKIYDGTEWRIVEATANTSASSSEVLFSGADGTLTGDANFTFDPTTDTLSVTGIDGRLDGPVAFPAKSGEALAIGDVVYISGISGSSPVVSKAQANSASTMPAIGIVQNAAASSDDSVEVVTLGNINNFDTATPSWSVNDTLFVSATVAGGLENAAPAGEANLIQSVGKVVKTHSSTGVFRVGGSGVANSTPNLNSGNIFIGSVNGQAATDTFVNVLSSRAGIVVSANDLTVDRNLIPNGDETLDLGSSSAKWRDLYLSGSSIEMGGHSITVDNGNLEFNDSQLLTQADPAPGGDLTLPNQGEIRFTESTTNGSQYISVKAPTSVTANTSLVLPDGAGNDGQILKTDGTGNLSWTNNAAGEKGNKGAEGDQGTKGEVGPTGEKGDKGGKGEIGLGEKGAQGIKGISGTKGNAGSNGEKGSTGASVKGDKGVGGDQGIKGATGEKGVDGTVGAKGSEGASVKGSKGIKGDGGDKGIKGEIGVGEKGDTGAGTKGVKGEQGIKGDTGVKGIQGTEGVQGEKGATGVGTQGEKGATGVKGAKGDEGDTGAKGTKGEIGIGEKGIKGNDGSQGAKGVDGTPGLKGSTGAGEKGEKGVGEKGTKGELGPKGDKGDTIGTKGVKGDLGPKGTKGDKGDEGDEGAQGIKGSTGEAGGQGIKGNIGPNGEKGSKGEIGVGEKGIQGIKGTKGDDGSKGQKGAEGNFGGATFQYDFSTDTTAADPTAGIVKLNNSTQSSADAMYIDDLDGSNADISNFLSVLANVTSTTKGYVRLVNRLDTADYISFEITDLTDNTGWWTLDIGNAVGPGVFTNNEEVLITFSVNGDQGDTGAKGERGVKGDKGLQGVKGQKGEDGTQGVKGVKGEIGIGEKGSTGGTGLKGDKGDTGAEGPVGTKGATGAGEKGDKGDDGSQGVKGVKGEIGVGEKGATGAGEKGDKGDDGSQGVKGVKGEIGVGEKGATGASVKGEPGVKGDDGTEGGTGAKGSKGDDGATGGTGGQGIKGNKGESVTGAKGDKGIQGEQGNSVTGAKGQKGEDGPQGVKGQKGEVPADVYVDVAGDNMTGNLTLGTDKITLNSTNGKATFLGDVGIGTDNPQTKLEVKSGTAELTLNSTNDTYSRINHQLSGVNAWTVGTRDTDDYHIRRESASTGDVLIPFGNVGIGGTLPSAPNITLANDGDIVTNGFIGVGVDPFCPLTVQGEGSSSLANFKNADNGRATITLAGNNTTQSPQMSSTGDDLNLRTNFTDRLRVRATSGDVLIGGTFPSAPNITLNANGSAEFAGSVSASGLDVENTIDSTTGGIGQNLFGTNFISGTASIGIGQFNDLPGLQGYGSGTAYHLLLNPREGRVGIGSTDAPTNLLTVTDNDGTGIRSKSVNAQTTDTNKALHVSNGNDTDTFSVSYRGTVTAANYITAIGYNAEPANSADSGFTVRNPGDSSISVDFNGKGEARFSGSVESESGGFVFPDGTTQTTASQGIAGQKGQKGQNGNNGSNGGTGAKGAKGDRGPNGSNGSNGGTGAKGDKGARGPNGNNGSNGSDGDKGQKGAKGERGPSGSNGSNGGTGQKGAPGEDGSNGGTGAKGQKGAQGPNGNNGSNGGTGAKGQKGAKGERGNNGSNGGTGGTGAKGQKGQKGQNGNNGSNGGTGQKGQKGQAGSNGSNGSTGQKGAPGSANALPYSGGTMTGDISMNGNDLKFTGSGTVINTTAALTLSGNNGGSSLQIDSTGTTCVNSYGIRYTVGNAWIGFEYASGSQCVARFNGGVWGNISISGSDVRLKENITPLDSALGTVNQLRPVTFTWKDESYYIPKHIRDNNKVRYGFIADEVMDLIPEAGVEQPVTENNPDPMKDYDERALISLLTKAVQELSAKVTSLEQRNA